MRLIDIYRHDVARMKAKEATLARRYWHHAAKRACVLRWLTSDPLPPFHIRTVHERPGDDTSPTFVMMTIPLDSFFLKRPEAELLELYRLTKSRPEPRAK